MNTYSRALRHIDINDVKQKHQQKLAEQKTEYDKKIEEKKYIEAKLKNEKYDWRKEINASITNKSDEKVFDSDSKDLRYEEYNWRNQLLSDKKKYFEAMTSAGTFFTTLPALGDTDLSSYNIADPSSYTDLDQYGVTSKSGGSGTGVNGGFDVENHIVFSGTNLNSRSVEFKYFDTTNTDTIKLTGIVGNDNNGGISPASPLELFWYNNITGEYGYENIIPVDGSSSLQDYFYTLPPGAIGNNISFYLIDNPNDGEMYIGKTLPVSGINNFPLTAEFANLLQFHVSLNNVQDGPDPTGQITTYHSIGFYYWTNIQNQKYPGYIGFGGAPNGDPAPISGATKYANLTNADLIYVGKQIYNYFKNSSTYGVTNFSVQRRTPKNVFVPINSPEATSFIRSEPNLSNLSPQEKLQKLKEMLKSSDEYVEKMLGSNFPGTGAVPPGEASDTPGVQVTNISSNKGIFTSPKSDAFLKAFNQGRSVPVDNLGRPITGSNSSTSTSTSVSASKSSEQRSIDHIKKEIEIRTKLQTTGDAQKYYSSPSMQRALDKLKADLASREKEFADKYGSSQNNQQSSIPQPSQPQLDQYGRQIGTPLPPGVQQDMEKGGKTASPVGDAAIIAAAAALAKSGFKGAPSSVQTGSQLPAKGSAEWQRMSKEFTRANPGQYNPFMSDVQNKLMQKYGVGTNAIPLKPIKNSYEPEGQLISERKKLKSPQEVLNKIPGYYDGKPAPLGFPETPPPEMVNGMHPDLVDGKKVADRFNRLDPESAKSMPLTGNPHIDKKVKAARKQPK